MMKTVVRTMLVWHPASAAEVVAQVDSEGQWLLHRGAIEGRRVDVDCNRGGEKRQFFRDIVEEQRRRPVAPFDSQPNVGQVVGRQIVGLSGRIDPGADV